MPVRYPSPLRPGDRIGITAPSSGVPEELRERLAVAVREVEARGYAVVTGRCMDGSGHASASAADRAAELTAMLTDPGIRAVVPPWGGETAIDLLPLLDWDRLREAEPTWVVGYSDLSTVMTPLTLLTGAATVHGNNLMDTPYRVPEGLVSWLDIVAAPPGHRFAQIPPERHRATGRDDYAKQPDVRDFALDTPGRWTRLDGGGDVDVEGRLHRGLHRDAGQHRGHAVSRHLRLRPGARPGGASGVRGGRMATTRSPSAAICTACGWPDSSTRPTPYSSAGPRPRTWPRSRSTRPCWTHSDR